MEITTRDVLTVLGLVFMGTGVYVAIVQRVTRMEALVHRVEAVEQDVTELQRKGANTGEELARLAALLEGQARQILALEGTVDSGIAEVLREIRASRPRGQA